MSHTCHAAECTQEIPRERLFCTRHWRMLPRRICQRVYQHYRPGQCDDWQITHEYAEAAREAVRFVADLEGVDPSKALRVYDMLDPGPVPYPNPCKEIQVPDPRRRPLPMPTPTIVPMPDDPWTAHCVKWMYGCGAHECATARKIILAKGTLPCQVLFVGEAPGESEDVLGYPFAGPAGHLLDHCVRQAFCGEVHCGFTNIVGCIPREEDGGKATEPLPEQIMKCQPRLAELVALAAPRVIVAVGALPAHWLDPQFLHALKPKPPVPVIQITHPAAILRANVIHKAMMVQKVVLALEDIKDEYLQ